MITHNRSIYTVLGWLGDVGGLAGFFNFLGSRVINFILGDSLTWFVMSKLFFTDEQIRGRKSRKVVGQNIDERKMSEDQTNHDAQNHNKIARALDISLGLSRVKMSLCLLIRTRLCCLNKRERALLRAG